MKKCIVLTTVNKPTRAVHEFIKSDYDVIIVGDKKTPDDFHKLDCTFLDVKAQHELFPAFSKLLPFNGYCRKNIGYLYAFTRGYDLIAESDDDNIPLPGWGELPTDVSKTITAPQYPNVYSLYTQRRIWPRGFPLDRINLQEDVVIEKRPGNDIFIIQGLADNSPDVDAIYRLTVPDADRVKFDAAGEYALGEGVVSAFNTQNTFWVNRLSFPWLYLPITVTFRYTDILKSYIAQFGIRSHGGKLAFIGATVHQDRNEHDLMDDFALEVPIHLNFYKVMHILENIRFTRNNEDLKAVYESLCAADIVAVQELEAVTEWISILNSCA